MPKVNKDTGEIETYGHRLPRQPGTYDPRAACEECCIQDFGPSMTQQSQAEEADINTIVKKFGLTGQLPPISRLPTYDDFTEVTDFQTAMNAVREAQDSFMKIPAAIRARFSNDPQEFVEFCSNPDNLPELRRMGLAAPETPQETSNPTGSPAGGSTPTEAPK